MFIGIYYIYKTKEVGGKNNMSGLIHYKNYYMYAEAVRENRPIEVYVPAELEANNIQDHIAAITNILRDGIESDYVHNCKMTIKWESNIHCKLSIVDYWYNLFMWAMLLELDMKIRPNHIFFSPELKGKNIKSYIDKFVLSKTNKKKFSNQKLNDIICRGVWNFSMIEEFSYYLANTINNEDDLDLMNASKDFYDLMHYSMEQIPFEDVKDLGMKLTNQAINIIKDSKKLIGYDHGLANPFRASEAVSPKQFKEVLVNIGTKPTNDGGIYPYIINQSYKTGGVDNPLYYFIESSAARVAQILGKINVGDSGDFARLLGINNTDTILNQNEDYACLSKHFIKFEIKSKQHLSMIKNRYYRFNPMGMEYMIDDEDESLIGKTIYMRSPITCASNSDGHGICPTCYGDLYLVNRNINVGKIAAEILSSQLTQRLLSAKHLIDTNIEKIVWTDLFLEFFEVEADTIRLNSDLENLKGYSLIIDPESVILVNDEDYVSNYDDDGEVYDETINNYSEYINGFIIKTPTGEEIPCGSADQINPDPLYISYELNKIIRKKAYNSENRIAVPLKALVDEEVLFYIKINNNQLNKTMNQIMNVINKSEVTRNKTKDEAVQDIVDLVVEGGISIDAIHLEVILSNQVISVDNPLKKPDWNNIHVQHKMCTLNDALNNNPSIIVSMMYKDLGKTFYNPLSFSKHGVSFFDLFYMEQPQNYISDDLLIDESPVKKEDEMIVMASVIKKEEENKE